MSSFNSDLLPPIFDQVAAHFGERAVGPDIRASIVKTLHLAIVKAAAENVKEMLQTQKWKDEGGDYPELQTSDRLSGASLSRARLVEQMQTVVQLAPPVLETALLFIESQIDLRLNRRRTEGFELWGIRFSLADRENDITSWCKGILSSILQGASDDRSTIWRRLWHHQPEGIRILVEGLQFAATLRDAVAYKIKVERYHIDPIVKGSHEDSGSRIRVLHISDLHMVENITERGRKLSRPFGAATHQCITAELLAPVVQDLKHDLLLATGDLTTDGARGSFETVREYIQRGAISWDNPMRIAIHGLSAGPGNRLLLPGNHDRFMDKFIPGQRRSGLFEEVLKTRWPYPYVVGYRPPRQQKNVESLTLLFFVFDSGLPDCPETTNLKGRLRAIARGSLVRGDIDEFKKLASDAVQNKSVPDLYGEKIEFNPQKTIRIAVLHHHPFLLSWALKKTDPFLLKRTALRSAQYLSFFLSAIRL
jgi:hypothetical protein